jgi:hypothetical protein
MKSGAEAKRDGSPIAAATPAPPIMSKPRSAHRFCTRGNSDQVGICARRLSLSLINATGRITPRTGAEFVPGSCENARRRRPGRAALPRPAGRMILEPESHDPGNGAHRVRHGVDGRQLLPSDAKAQTRLCQRYRQLMAKGKPRQVVVTAIARKLAGFVRDLPAQAGTASTRRRTRG